MVTYKRCWACDKLVGKIDSNIISRFEYHHVFGTKQDEKVVLCVLCHDLVDRFKLDDIEVFSEYIKVIEEFESMPRGKYPIIRLLLLKIIKIMNIKKNENSTQT